MTISSAKQSKKEYAEQPFSLNGLIGSQFTIEEKLGVSELPRVGRKEGISKFQKPYNFEIVKLKISDGTFEKDLHMTEQEFKEMCIAIPDSLINLQGLTLKVSRKPGTFGYKFEYIGVARQNMEGNSYQNGNPNTIKPPEQAAPTEVGNQIRMLHQGVELNQKMAMETDIKRLMAMAEAIRPGDAMGLIDAAKREGWIIEAKPGIYRGT